MQYMLKIFVDETQYARMTPAEQDQRTGAYHAYSEALRQAGVLRGGARLEPSTAATTVRLVDGRPQVLDGPYVDSREQLGGYFLIEVADLDAALSWAHRCPGVSHGIVEVHPIAYMPIPA